MPQDPTPTPPLAPRQTVTADNRGSVLETLANLQIAEALDWLQNGRARLITGPDGVAIRERTPVNANEFAQITRLLAQHGYKTRTSPIEALRNTVVREIEAGKLMFNGKEIPALDEEGDDPATAVA